MLKKRNGFLKNTFRYVIDHVNVNLHSLYTVCLVNGELKRLLLKWACSAAHYTKYTGKMWKNQMRDKQKSTHNKRTRCIGTCVPCVKKFIPTKLSSFLVVRCFLLSDFRCGTRSMAAVRSKSNNELVSHLNASVFHSFESFAR